MAGEALLRIRFKGLPGRVDVVAGRAAHLRSRAIAFTALEKPNLISVNVRMLNIGGWKRFEVITQRLARNVREGGRKGFTLNPVMAFCAQINLPFAGELRGIQNAPVG